MIRILLIKQLDEKAFKEKRRITLSEVSEKTGISRATLTRIANVPGNVTNTDTINALCKYFECEPGELLMYVEDESNTN
ncbi:helix-turn-helix transcriptional regulator [Shewanella xiamenensis]|uniref:helix-turn-helix domain-containing protein n=1 Tax=Shewanella TaxID=22 RepID=UPI0015590239|nr:MULTISPECIES: helix-turn-helix transcriptional regulator [Shewanella]MCU8045744.1 helix-turn-helix transcriptional regulator [Shewanella sp. SM68]MCU8050074.1 helix-turn-helix transcriptional regulator [Shewanella sp. SM65]MCU8061006.1 helix-turn-helix transcriptional regulator [Shewanella sp. SM55]MCU8090199.1 helix-turn-helix transcriptional regulator [Shewanella sp. SM20]MDH1316108.1 helix-turn-helix transcriptional regulator [Shewanella xiamenensis]